MAEVGSLKAPELIAKMRAAALAARSLCQAAKQTLAGQFSADGRLEMSRFDKYQRKSHGFAWLCTLAECLFAAAAWAQKLETDKNFRRVDRCALIVGTAEYAAQLAFGVPMSQSEIVRPAEFGCPDAFQAFANDPCVRSLLDADISDVRSELVELLAGGETLSDSLGDDTLDQIRGEIRKFSNDRIIPHAQQWHLKDDLIPDDLIAELAALGVFGLTIDSGYGGMGLGKLAMCVVTEELSRAWIAAGSLGTRSEIAAELIAGSGTEEQKRRWLPGIAAGTCLPTAVFTEPDIGSDLGSLRTRAVLSGDGWRIYGAKNWITHAARSDLMTVLVRTKPGTASHEGLSMLIAEKPRGTRENPFPAAGMSGSEIGVLGYRGMREYALSFDGFSLPADGLLGGEEGQGFRQLMRTFEAARIQTAARAIGVARRALELGLRYALDRKQFGSQLVKFPRVSDKLAIMASEILMARELTYMSARQKDTGLRTDIEAGMAKLIAARVAWSAADAALQIHGGNGYALEYEISRVLVDSRILNIFEGAAEIQAQVVARGILQRKGNQ